MKTVLMTGADGALGRAILARLDKDRNWTVMAAGRRAGKGLQLDMRNAPDFQRLLEHARPDLVLHFAASFSNDFDEAYAINVEATRRLLEAVQSSAPSARVLLVGSAAEYGPVRIDENPIREDHALNPVSVYGLSKAWQTQLAGLYASRGVDVVVARLFNLQAAGLSERLFVGRVQKQIEEVRAGLRNSLELGPLTAIRDYVDADEAAEQLLAIALRGQAGGIYHVGSGKPIAMRELLDALLIAEDLKHLAVHESATNSNRSGYDVPAIYADMTSTRRLMQQGSQRSAAI